MLEQLMNDFDVWMEDFFPQACQAATKGKVHGKTLCVVIFKGEFKGAKWFNSESIELVKDYVFIPIPTLEPHEDKGRWTLSDFQYPKERMRHYFVGILLLENQRRMDIWLAQGERIREDLKLVDSRYPEEYDYHDEQ